MLNRKKLRDKGKISFTRYFQTFNKGDSVALVKEHSLISDFPSRVHGRTGTVIGSRGAAYVVEVSDLGNKKQYIVKPVHLKKITTKP